MWSSIKWKLDVRGKIAGKLEKWKCGGKFGKSKIGVGKVWEIWKMWNLENINNVDRNKRGSGFSSIVYPQGYKMEINITTIVYSSALQCKKVQSSIEKFHWSKK